MVIRTQNREKRAMAIQEGVKKISKFIVMREHVTFKQWEVTVTEPQGLCSTNNFGDQLGNISIVLWHLTVFYMVAQIKQAIVKNPI